MKTRTILLALALTLAPATAHAAYTDPEQTGHGSGSFEVCTTPTQPGPWTYIVTARDPRIIRVPEDSWLLGRTDGSWVRAVAVDGRARIVTAVPLSGQVGDSIKVRAPGTDATTDLHLIAVMAPTCTTPSPTPTGSPTWTPSPTPSASSASPTPSGGSGEPSPTSPAPTPTTAQPTPTTSQSSTATPLPSGCTTGKDCDAPSTGAELAHTGALGALYALAAGVVLAAIGLAVWPRGRRH